MNDTSASATRIGSGVPAPAAAEQAQLHAAITKTDTPVGPSASARPAIASVAAAAASSWSGLAKTISLPSSSSISLAIGRDGTAGLNDHVAGNFKIEIGVVAYHPGTIRANEEIASIGSARPNARSISEQQIRKRRPAAVAARASTVSIVENEL